MWSGWSLTASSEAYATEKGFIERRVQLFDDASQREAQDIRRKQLKEEGRRLVRYDIPEYENPKDKAAIYRTRNGIVLDWTLGYFDGAGRPAFAETSEEHANRIIDNTASFEKWARKNNREEK